MPSPAVSAPYCDVHCDSRVLGGRPQMSKAAKLQKKRVEDVLGGEEAWKNAPRSQSALCPGSSKLGVGCRQSPAKRGGHPLRCFVFWRWPGAGLLHLRILDCLFIAVLSALPSTAPEFLIACSCAPQRNAQSAATARRTTTRCRRGRRTSRPRCSSAASSATTTGRRADVQLPRLSRT